MTRKEACEHQGARCGHIDGKARVGSYVLGEEMGVELDCFQEWLTREERQAWTWGYQRGYRVGADGEPLDPETIDAPLPEDCQR